MNLADLRKDYQLKSLDEQNVLGNPIEQFKVWLEEAKESPQVLEANAMHLASVSADGKPTIRVVLLKGIDEGGFVFFTNYLSRKGQDFEQNSYACINFFWEALERQVRIEGKIEKITSSLSDDYYNSRPLGSRIGAWVSPQSKVVEKDFLEKKFVELSQKFDENKPPLRPDYWGGYRLVPEYLEFWQGRPSRLHDRIVYEKKYHNWTIKRIAP